MTTNSLKCRTSTCPLLFARSRRAISILRLGLMIVEVDDELPSKLIEQVDGSRLEAGEPHPHRFPKDGEAK